MDKKLIHKIGKKEYLIMDTIIADSDKEKELINMGCIEQCIKKVDSGGMFSSAYAIVSFLVPIDKIQKFQRISV